MGERYAGQAVLVTGGASGIGRAVAAAFADEGAGVIIVDRDESALATTLAQFREKGKPVAGVSADISAEADVARAVKSAAAEFGRFHVAVNAAGILHGRGELADLPENDWQTVLNNNLTGTWLSMKHEIAHLRSHDGGVVINIGSVVGTRVTIPGLGAYAATKAGIAALTRTAALECIADGIRVALIVPGPIDTAMSRLPGEGDAQRDARTAGELPIGRIGRTGEVAGAALWLASPQAELFVGHELVLDGGSTV
ncbi:SDR family NAD(P)-dependent oxidoreductase [Nonomuraea sp. NPDC051191]|uniref:SDR family NAD(P)-dependent oxidoreductase n=1 Tax=Nonomuraea sp. NPDC051191 TaxID=3364372 RepID=UPI00379564F9